jgi:uncharacterized protein
MKYLLFFAFLAAVWWLWSKRQVTGGAGASPQEDPVPEKMVACAYCGVHLPESEGVVAGDRVYCSEAHRLAVSDTEQ